MASCGTLSSALTVATVLSMPFCNFAKAFSVGSIPRTWAGCHDRPRSYLAATCLRRYNARSSYSAIFQSLQERGALEYGDGGGTSLTPQRSELETMTVPQLKEELRLRGEKVSGKKSDLIDRILGDSEDTATELSCEGERTKPADSQPISVEKELGDDLFDDDDSATSADEDDISWGGEGVPTYEDYKEKLEALAFLSSIGDGEATKGAQHTFDEMYENYITEDESSLLPDTQIYNLLVDAYASSDPEINKKGMQKATEILDRMESGESGIAPPNVYTYIAVIRGLAKRKQPLAADNTFRRLEARYALTGSNDVKPNTESYNALIKAWTKSGLKTAPKQTEDLANEMIDANDESVRPNSDSFALVMNCYAQTGEKDAVKKVQALLDEMESLDLKPNIAHYNAQIKAFGGKGIKGGASRAETLLHEMIERYKLGDTDSKPDNASFINAINALTRSRQNDAPQRAEKLLDVMESIEDELRPNVKVFNACINAWARSRELGKAEASRRLLDKMMDLSANDDTMTPNTRSFNNVLNACAFTGGSKEEKLAAFRIAVRTLNDLRDSGSCEPDHVSYGMFLQACAKLMPPSKKRDSVVENIFRTCARDGKVSQFVLDAAAEVASGSLLNTLLGTNDFEDDIDIPVDWSRNVK